MTAFLLKIDRYVEIISIRADDAGTVSPAMCASCRSPAHLSFVALIGTPAARLKWYRRPAP
jgi:hypothetical protein